MGQQQSRSRAELYEQYYKDLQRGGQLARDPDPYDILGLSKNYTWDELKDAYRRTARWVHPDKGGTEAMFNLVTDAFKKLALEYKSRQADRPHHELKREAQAAASTAPTFTGMPPPLNPRTGMPTAPVGAMAGAGAEMGPGVGDAATFSQKFNAYFDANKFEDETDEMAVGYGSMMVASSKKREDLSVPQLYKGKFKAERFNQAFEEATLPASSEVVVYREPEALSLAKSIKYTEIGADRPDDFTKAPLTRNEIAYTDYKVAATTTRLVDPRAVQPRKEFKNVEEFKKHWSSVTKAPPTEEELQWRAQKEREEQEKEERRLARLSERDRRAQLHYEHVSRGMLDHMRGR